MPKSRFSIPAIMALVAVSLFVGAPTPAGAANIGPFHLTDVSQTASWSGELPASPPVLPQACVPDVCDIVEVNVDLPEDVWAEPGGMLVATQPPPDLTEVNIFDLYVYGPGADPATDEPVATATSTWSNGAHGAWVENPANGVYTIVVAPDLMFEPPGHYDGLVSFARGLTVKRDGELKDGEEYQQKFVTFAAVSPESAEKLEPDLVPTTPRDFHIATGFCWPGLFLCAPTPHAEPQQPSCYPEETAGATLHEPNVDPPLRCLRFTQGETNVGDGPLELHIYPDQGSDVYQRIYRSDGSVTQNEVGRAVFHPQHSHFHYTTDEGWWEIKLYHRLPNGEPDLKEVVARFGAKGICPLDTWNGRFGQPGDGPQAYGNDDLQTCMTARHQDPNDPTFPGEDYIQAGISPGWTDEYGWAVKEQYIDITDVADGEYVIVTKQDPGGALIEKTTANNTAMACVEISGLTARPCPMQPDLQVSNLSASNTKGVREGEKVTITATVANIGEGEAAASSTDILLDGTRLPGGLLDTPALSPGESATLSLNWDTRGVKGEHRITATADSARAVEESNEENNAREITVTLRGNKVRNPSFEESSNGSSPDHWSSSGETGYESGGSDGVRSVSTGPGGSWTSESVPIEAGASYEASVAASGAGGTLLVQQLTADGSVLSSAGRTLLPSEVFTLTSLQLTALPGAVQARVVLLGGLTGKTTFDDVGLFGG